MNEVITKIKDPFPYLKIENLYTEEELELIADELIFLNHKSKLEDPEFTGSAEDSSGNVLKENKGLFLDDLYKRKEKEWVEKQKQIPNGNIKPGEGTRSRFLKSADRELTTLLHKDNVSISDNQLQESLNKIKSLMLL